MKRIFNRPKMTPRQIVLFLGVGTAISLLGESTLYTVLPIPHFAAQMGVTMTMVGILLGTNRAIRLFTNGPVGILYERYSRRPLLIFSLCLASISSLIYTVGFGFWLLFFGRILWGIAWSFLWIGSRTTILEISDENNRGYLNGIYQMCFLTGAGLTSFFGSMISDQFGFHFGQRLSAVIIFFTAIIWFLFLPEIQSEKKKSQKMPLARSQEPLRWKILIPLMITIFIARFIERGVLVSTASLWITNLFGNKLQIFGYLLPAATLAGLFNAVKLIPRVSSAPFFGYISDRLHRRWIIISLALIANGIGLWLMSVDALYLALFGVLLASLFSGSAETLIPAIIGDNIGNKASGRILGVIYIAADLGSTLGPIFSLALIDSAYLNIGELYRACVVLLLIGSVIAFIASRSEKHGELEHLTIHSK